MIGLIGCMSMPNMSKLAGSFQLFASFMAAGCKARERARDCHTASQVTELVD